MNGVVVVNIGKDDQWQVSKSTVEMYCDRYNHDLTVVEAPVFNFSGKNYNFLTFEKNQIYGLFDKYDKILRLDTDVIITQRCPDLFDFVDTDFAGVEESVGSRWANRQAQMRTLDKQIGSVSWKGYFNSGVVFATENIRDVFNIDRYKEYIREDKLGSFKEQNLMNYMLAESGASVFKLPHLFNHLSVFDEKGYTIDKSFILHYAGPQGKKVKKMKKDKEYFYG